MTPDKAALMALAEHHDRQGVFHAKQAASNASWYHGHAADTRRAADHFAVAAALKARAGEAA